MSGNDRKGAVPWDRDAARAEALEKIYAALRWRPYAPNGGALAPPPKQFPHLDDLVLTYNAIKLLEARYITRDSDGRPMETPSMVFMRVAMGFADRVNPKRLYRAMLEGRFLPNSPTLFNMYANGAVGALSACYVTPVTDDMEGIMKAATVQAMTFKYGGGQGFDFSSLRPRGAYVRGTGATASGPVSFMHLFDAVTDVVKQGGKRRGANMGVMHVWHPDIYNPGFDPIDALIASLPPQIRELIRAVSELISVVEREGYEVRKDLKDLVEELSKRGGATPPEEAGFIQAKEGWLGDAHLTNFNISVGINDAFMAAVLEGRDWIMFSPELVGYRASRSISAVTALGTTGEHLLRGLVGEKNGVHVFEHLLEEAVVKAPLLALPDDTTKKNPILWRHPARKIWEAIVRNAWRSGDPGILFLDNHNKWIETPWLGLVSATNPCGEEYLYPFESCNLGSINLEKYVKDGRIDVEGLAEDVELAVDVLDAVIDYNRHPVPEQRRVNELTRKVGLGVMGLANALARLGIPYDSDEAVAVTLVTYALIEAVAWKRSWELAAELGHAPAFDCAVYDWRRLECVERTDPEKTLPMFVPALVKASRVVSTAGGWVVLRYHRVRISGEVMARLDGSVRDRVGPDGTVYLIKEDTLWEILEKYFGVTPAHLMEAKCPSSEPAAVVRSPKHLLALAVWEPATAWELITEYGRSLGARAPRHTAVTTAAPTGSISILASTSSGIEPFFALVYKRVVTVGEFLDYVRPFREDLEKAAERTGAPTEVVKEVMEIVAKHKGSLRWALNEVREHLLRKGIANGFLAEVEKLARKYATAMDFPLWYHIAHQAAAQLYVDQSISKTINLPHDADVASVETAYLVGWLAGLKGVTVYRDGSKATQVIQFGETSTDPLIRKKSAQKPRIRRLTKASNIGAVIVELSKNSTCETCDI